MKNKTVKKAYRVKSTHQEADELAKKMKMHVVVRPGGSIRCESYCDAKPFCNQFKKTQQEIT